MLKHVAWLPFVLGCTLCNILLLFLEGVAIASEMPAAKIYHLVRVDFSMSKVPRISKSNGIIHVRITVVPHLVTFKAKAPVRQMVLWVNISLTDCAGQQRLTSAQGHFARLRQYPHGSH